MNKHSETTAQKIIVASRRTLIFSLVCFVLSGAMSLAILYLHWVWLEAIAKVILVFALLGFGILGIAPAAFIIVGTPQLALAWYRGVNRVAWWSDKPWEALSLGAKIFLLLWSAFLVIAVIMIAVNFEY